MKYKILLLCDFNRFSANTIIDHALSFMKYSKHDIFYCNPYCKNKPEWLSFQKIDIIVIHYSIYTLGDIYLNKSWRESITDSTAIKVMFIQDEYRNVYAFHERMNELGINILFTCFPEKEIERVYPSAKLPFIKVKVNNLTGYVPSYLENKKPDFKKKRPIDVGYRGRGMGFWWLGELYQEKSMISKEFLKHVNGTNIKCDISSREEDRIYGKDWITFMENCKCTLGTESGASVVDFTGKIEENVKQYCKTNPSATFNEVRELYFKDLEWKIDMTQISPRTFEAIGCGCCPILFEGNYSGILKKNVHYIELKKDFSNIDEVFEKIKNDDLIKNINKTAYEDIISSGRYSYKTFIRLFDRTIEQYVDKWGAASVPDTEEKTFFGSDISTPSINGPCHDNVSHSDTADRNNTKTHRPAIIRFYSCLKHGILKLYYRLRQLYILHPFFIREKIRLRFQLKSGK